MTNMGAGNFDFLQDKIRIRFNDLGLLRHAFIHRSYLNETKDDLKSNERLEFLGDSVLSFIISTHLYLKRPGDEEGDLTNLRSYIVKTKSLAEASANLDLGSYLLMSKGEEQSGGRNNPQLLANTFESLLGAIYLDQGIDITTQFVNDFLLPLFENEIVSGPPKDAKSSLQEVSQTKTKQSPVYRIVDTRGPDHAKEFVVVVLIAGKEYGRGVGSSKQIAEEEAATQALKKLT